MEDGNIEKYWRIIRFGFWLKILHYVTPKKVTYYTYKREPDIWDLKTKKVLRTLMYTGGVATGISTAGLSVLAIPASSGIATPLAYLGVFGGIATATTSAGMLYYEVQGSWYNPDPHPTGCGGAF